MALQFAIDLEQAKKVVADLELAAENGFPASLAIVRMYTTGNRLGDDRLAYDRSHVLAKADPADPNLDWGSLNDIKDARYRHGKFFYIDEEGTPP